MVPVFTEFRVGRKAPHCLKIMMDGLAVVDESEIGGVFFASPASIAFAG